MSRNTFADNLQAMMRQRGMTQVALAKVSGIKQQLISSYIRQSRMAKVPSVKNLLRLANALECSVDELVGVASVRRQSVKGKASISDLGMELAAAFDRLPDGDWRREAVRHLLLGRRE